MSQSPTGAKTPEEAYLQAWQELAVRIQQGASFSGRERNCAFLNTHETRFADISSAAGLDQIDDGRSVAVVDWDLDGDLDMWQVNRNGPRLRFLRNDVPTENRYVAFRLQGDPDAGTNRDAVGARVEMEIESANGQFARRVRTLAAGDGYLSQSSKWVHFGLGPSETVQRVTVRWPGSMLTEEFGGKNLSVNARYDLQQGTAKAVRWLPKSRQLKLAVSDPQPPAATDQSRLRFSMPPLVGSLNFERFDGKDESWQTPFDGPVFITLWASWCQPCLEELHALADRSATWKENQLRIVALNVEGLAGKQAPPADKLVAVLRRCGWSADSDGFVAGMATEELVSMLDERHRNAIYRDQPLPLPSSFLIDFGGWLHVAYKGPLDVETLVTDLGQLRVSETEGRQLSVPFAGRWSKDLFVTNPIAVSQTQMAQGYPEDAAQYLNQYLADHPPPDAEQRDQESQAARLRLADVYRQLGRIMASQGQYSEAIQQFRASLQWNPRLMGAQVELGRALILQGDDDAIDEAFRILDRLKSRRPGDASIRTELGLARQKQGHAKIAAGHYEAALQLNPNEVRAAGYLAWLRATHPDESLRDGRQALQLASQICKLHGFRDARSLDILAAAHAELGEFVEAVQRAEQAQELAVERGDTALADEIGQRAELYQSNRPFREP